MFNARLFASFGLLLLCMWFGMGRAEAATQQEANAACGAYATGYSGTVACADNGTSPCVKPGWATTDPGAGNGIVCGMRTKADGGDGGYVSWVYAIDCPAPQVWNQMDKRCMDPSECLAKNDALGNAIQSTDTDTNGCDGGCAMSMGTDYTTTTFGGHTVFTGKMRYTGQACATNPTKPPNDPEPECRPISGMTVCKRPDNKLCGKASNGKYVCWNPGETGEKTEGPTKQKVDAGPNPIPPNLNLPNGDTLTQQAPPVVTTESKPGQPTITKNITNYNTVNNTNAGPTDQGEGSEGEEGEEGEEEGKAGPKLTGGTNCNVPPHCDVVDDAACSSAIIQWRFVCEGSSETGSDHEHALLQVALLEASWDNDTQQYTDGAIQQYNEARAALAADVVEVESGGGMLDGLDDSGFLGAGQCPADIPLNIGPVTTGLSLQLLCDFLGNIGLLVEAFAYFAAIRILTGTR